MNNLTVDQSVKAVCDIGDVTYVNEREIREALEHQALVNACYGEEEE